MTRTEAKYIEEIRKKATRDKTLKPVLKVISRPETAFKQVRRGKMIGVLGYSGKVCLSC